MIFKGRRSKFTLLASGAFLLLVMSSIKFGCSLGPPHVVPKEAYDRQGTASFSHDAWARVLKQAVNGQGLVNYQSLRDDHQDLDRYLESIKSAPFDDFGRDDKLAFLINVYNACTVQLILDHYPLESIKDIPRSERWLGRTWKIANREWSLHAIEHEECRAKFVEPRVHFALNCASLGCPPLRQEPYRGAVLEEQLRDQAQRFVNDDRWLRLDVSNSQIHISKIFEWYEADFKSQGRTIIGFIAAYRSDLTSTTNLAIDYLPYDWSLNEWR